ncbi:hypothetical protein ABN763_16525 [Spongiivirga sp. MCCC 1A20706]|uniref:hypothetical protein n=1 Tax=Spongiivirga sp. MCCC 1A20706 TaxID=3160963 RepID=UPI003977580E
MKNEQVEHTITLTLPEDIQSITEAARESYYYLKNVGSFYDNEVTLPEGVDAYMYQEGGKKIKMLQEQFILLENRLYENYSAAIGTKLKYNKDLIATVIDYLMLKERMDNLQLATLQFIYANKNELINEIVDKNSDLDAINKLHTHAIQLNEAFDHSMDADKFVDYKISFSNEKWERKYSKKNVYPIIIRIIEHDYLLKRQRSQIAEQQKIQTALVKHLANERNHGKINEIASTNNAMKTVMETINKNMLIIGIIGIVLISIGIFLAVMNFVNRSL